MTVVVMLALFKMKYGRKLFAIGNNATVAKYSGIRVDNTIILSYAISGMTAGIAGALLAGKVGSCYLAMGDTYQFQSIAAVAIGVAAAISNPGSEKNSIQAVSGQTTESKENDMELPVLPIGTDGKSDSKEQTESTVEKDDPKSSDTKNTSGADSEVQADKKPSHSDSQESSDSKANTAGQKDQAENTDRDQSNDDNGKDSSTRSDQTTDNNKKQESQKDSESDKSDSNKKSSDTIELPFIPAD
jgi:hypothetical protein